jgi:hypothetical protein
LVVPALCIAVAGTCCFEVLAGEVGGPVPAFGLLHTGIGQAQLGGGTDHLVVSNIGSSGKDGVRQELPPSTQSNVHELAPPVPTGPYVIVVNSSVSLDGLPPGTPVIGSLYGDTTNPVELVVDLSALGAQTQTLEIDLDGELAFVQTGMAGVLVQTMQWFQPTLITVSGGPTIPGDELRVIPEPGGAAGLPALEELAASEIRVIGGLDALIIINQAALPAAAWVSRTSSSCWQTGAPARKRGQSLNSE